MAYLLTYKQKRLADLNVNPTFSMADFKAVPKEWRERISEYVKGYGSLNALMSSAKLKR